MAAVLAAFSLLQSAASAQTTATGSAPPGLDGKDTFQQYCAVCHGLQGKGDGPAASALKSRPSDLATLAKRNGTFPAAHVTNVLKGMDPVVAHGSTAMMTWGAVFLADVNGDRSKADARINAVVRFIESLQVK
jgi:mono/diheme cytochrome c family protein